MPFLQWDAGDSSWDKVRVWGRSPRSTVTIYRHESPGPFTLTILLERGEEEDLETTYRALRREVLEALNGWIWEPLQPQAVALIQPEGRFPSSYEFDCDRTLADIEKTLGDAGFWYWEILHCSTRGLCLEGRIPFRRDGSVTWSAQERVRITGETPKFSIEVGHWVGEPGRVPSCDEVHEVVQNTLLPAIGARNVRAANTSRG